MLDLWRQGHQVVYGIRRSTDEGAVTSWSRRAFYRLIASMSEDDLPLNAGELRLVDACILAQLRTVNDTSPYMRGLISSMGFRSEEHTSELQSLMRISYAVFCLTKKTPSCTHPSHI